MHVPATAAGLSLTAIVRWMVLHRLSAAMVQSGPKSQR